MADQPVTTDGNRWKDPTAPPVEATDHGGVWSSWDSEFQRDGTPVAIVWHWCSNEIRSRTFGYPVGPTWRESSARGHDLISTEPLHLEPSLYWPDCCGKHGFLRDGRWQEV